MDGDVGHLVKENLLRSSLTYFYDAVLVTENAKLLSQLGNLSDHIGSGNMTAVDGFTKFIDWIQHMSEYAREGNMFENNILSPFRMASSYCITAKSMDIRGLIFSISDVYFDRSFNSDQVTVSIISPDLSTAVSIRIKEKNAANLTYGFYQFEHVKAIPLTNRLHQYKPKITKLDADTGFNRWDFLSTRIADLESFDHSIEVEHYCEIPIYDDKRQRILGATLTITGIVKYVDGPRITIQSTTSDNKCTFYVSGILKNMDLDDYKGECVKALVVKWYQESQNKSSRTRDPGIYFIAKINKYEAKIHDVIGYVRIRKKVMLEKLGEIFSGLDFSKIAGLKITGNSVSFLNNSPIINESISDYNDVLERISALRIMKVPDTKPLCVIDDVLDPNKLSSINLAKNGNIVLALEAITRSNDYKTNAEKAKRLWMQISRNTRQMLKETSRVIEENGVLKITDSGLMIVYIYKIDQIHTLLDGLDIVSVTEFESEISPSLLCHHLNNEGYKKIKFKNVPLGILWQKNLDKQISGLDRHVNDIILPLLNKMSGVNYPLHQDAIKELLDKDDAKMKISVYSLLVILQFMVESGFIYKIGESYGVSLDKRIYAFLMTRPNLCYPIRELCNKIIVPITHKPNQPGGLTSEQRTSMIKSELDTLRDKKIAIDIIDGWWCAYTNTIDINKTRKKLLITIIQRKIKQYIITKPISKVTIFARLHYSLKTQLRGNGWNYDPNVVFEEALDDLIDRKIINITDDMIRYRSQS